MMNQISPTKAAEEAEAEEGACAAAAAADRSIPWIEGRSVGRVQSASILSDVAYSKPKQHTWEKKFKMPFGIAVLTILFTRDLVVEFHTTYYILHTNILTYWWVK